MLNNPATWFVTGSKQKSFTYKPGTHPFHFSPYDSGLSKYLDCNIIVFADDFAHAKSIIEQMFVFGIECFRLYEEYITEAQKTDPYYHGIDHSRHVEKYQRYLDSRDEWVIVPVHINQPFKVSWAGNDTI